ncbi:MAG: FAD-binding oxidoreductase [Clostridiaceae bacterium]
MKFNELTGKVITPTNEEYDILRLEYNRDINKFPIAMVYCYNPVDVSNAIKWCRKNSIGFRIRTGGHNYEGYSTDNGVIVIDTSYMNKIFIDNQNDVVKIQAGARLGNIYGALADEGYAFNGGTCPSVAISGLVLGGGIGLSCRNFGLVTDNLLEIQMVDASGNIITANKYSDRELFWACRGAGGGNFGVAVSYIFKVHKVDKVTLIQLRWNGDSRIEFFNLWQNWLKTADKKISCFAGFYKESIYLNGFFYGPKFKAEEILEKFLMLPGLLKSSSIEYVPFIDAVRAIGSFYGPPDSFKSTGRFVYTPFTKRNITKLVEYVDNSPGKDNCSIRFYSLGGTIKELPSNYSAYYYRNAEYIIGISSDWEKEDGEIYKDWVSEVFQYIKPLTNGSYVNFPYSGLKNYGLAYYGDNYHHLRKVKTSYDPENIFKFQQSIIPYSCD